MVTKYNRSRKDELMLAKYGDRYAQYRKQWDSFNGRMDSEFPLHTSICNNYSCNLKCKICLVDDVFKKGSKIMENSLIDNIFAELNEHNAPSINVGSFTEPLSTIENFKYIINSASKSNVMDIFVHTNGINLKDDVIKFILDSRINVICVSLDATIPETYADVRGANFLEKIETNLHRILELKEQSNNQFPLIRVSFCRNPLNIHEVDSFFDKWKDIVDLVEFQNYIYRPNVNIAPDDRFEKLVSDHLCLEPFRRCDITPDGDMLCCCTMRTDDTILGNLKSKSIYEMWNSDKMKEIRQTLLTNTNLNKTCMDCTNSWFVQKKG